MVMSALMSEIDSEPEEEPRTSRSVASRRSYADYSPPPRSSARLIKLPPPPPREAPARRPDLLKMSIKGIDVSSTTVPRTRCTCSRRFCKRREYQRRIRD